MPFSYDVDPEVGLVRTWAEGTVTDQDVMELKQALLNDPRITRGMPQLSDVRGVEDLQVTPEGIRTMVSFDRHADPSRSPGRLAIVADAEFVFGMARMYELTGDTGRVAVFRDEEKALKWLGEESEGQAPTEGSATPR